jgi:D-alanine-D-alanine ligase
MESKKYFIEAGVDVPQAVLFKGGGSVLKLQGQLPGPIEKYVIKPLRQGSSVGISIVEGENRAVETAKRCEEEFGDCMVEQYIAGRELTAGVLCGSCLPIIEIKPKEKFYNYHAKYVDEKTQFLFDTIEDEKITRRIEAKALKSFEVMGLRDFARFDFILSDDGRIFALEVNAIPGLTGHSLLPMAAKKAGISISQLCIRVIESAVERSNCRTQDASQKDGGQEEKSGRR